VSAELLTAEAAVPSNPEWHKLRRAGISASEIAMVLSISPWGSPFSLYWAKREGWETEDSAEMRAGRYAEPAVAAWYAEHGPDEDVVLRRAGLYAHADRPWQLATPDRLICLDRICGRCDAGLAREPCTCADDLVSLLECKYVIGGWEGWGEEGTDDIPVYYRAQGLWQADVLGVDRVVVAAWHAADFRAYVVRHDEKDLRMMRTAARSFLDRMEAGDAPDIDGHSETIRALKLIHPSIEDVDLEVPVELAEGYRRARAARSRADGLVDRYDARLREALGSARRLVCNGHLVASRSIYDQSGDMVELDSLDADPPIVDRLNPGRAANYLTPKTVKKGKK
jgi:putative phage-type endonuclease